MSTFCEVELMNKSFKFVTIFSNDDDVTQLTGIKALIWDDLFSNELFKLLCVSSINQYKEWSRFPVSASSLFCFIYSFSFFLEILQVLAFRDIAPQAPTHIIIIPKVKDGLTRLAKVYISNLSSLASILTIISYLFP